MKAARENCRECGIALEPAELGYDLCLRCAKSEVTATRRFALRGLIVGLVLSALVFLLMGGIQQGIADMDPKMRNPNLDAIAALPYTARFIWAGLAFTIPFGYYHKFKTKGLNFQEPTWAGGGGHRTPTNSELAASMMVILGIVTAPVVAPLHIAYRIARAARLRRYIQVSR